MMGVTTRSSSRKQNSCCDTKSRESKRQVGCTISSENKQHINAVFEESPVTPPKLIRIDKENQNSAVQDCVSPTQLLEKLAIKSPTIKNSNVEDRKTKKSLFSKRAKNQIDYDEDEEEDVKCKLSKENDEVVQKPSQYQSAGRALHSHFLTNLPGRENEIGELSTTIIDSIKYETSTSIYVSGCPGTGKTASLNLILGQVDLALKIKGIYINCTSIKSATSVYLRIMKELNVKAKGKSEKDCLAAVEKYLCQKHKMILLVLDEIDQLESKNQSVLYTIFEWPAKPNSKIVLVGIANALDFTNRVLPRLQTRCELQPKLIHFAPYTKDQIIKIFTSRLESAGALEVFSPVALQMLAAKVASISGDVRRALDIGRRVIKMIDDQSSKNDILKSVENFTQNIASDKNLKKSEEAKTVNVKEVVSVLNNVYGTSQNLTDNADESFPLQQKIVLCTLLLVLKKAKNKNITLGKLHEIYTKVCSKRNIMTVDQTEFVGLCSLIETRGIIRVIGKKDTRLSKISLEWNETEVAEALKDKQLMSSILQDESCLTN